MEGVSTQHKRTSRTVSRQEARQAVEFAQAEVLRAEKRCDGVEANYRAMLEASHSWLAECQRRLRVAEMQLRRVEPAERAEPVDPAPWLPPADDSLFDWQRKITPDVANCFEDD